MPNDACVRAFPWLRLFRVPNLFTVPGDPLAGFLLAGALRAPSASFTGAWAAAGASLALYAAGLASNDWFDLEIDRRERPERPLPGGAIRPAAALAAGAVLGAAGVAAAFLAGAAAGGIAAALAAATLLYNAGGKRVPGWGPLNMGLCRGLSFLLGAAAAGGSRAAAAPPLLFVAAALSLYVAAVTRIASRENEPGPVGPWRWGPIAAMALYLSGLALARAALPRAGGLPWSAAAFVAAGALGLAWAWRCARRLGRGAPVPPIIGALVRGLLPMQAAAVTLAAPWGIAAAAALLLAWPIAGALSRRFAAS